MKRTKDQSWNEYIIERAKYNTLSKGINKFTASICGIISFKDENDKDHTIPANRTQRRAKLQHTIHAGHHSQFA